MNTTFADSPVPKRRELRLRFPLVCLALFWIVSIGATFFEKPYFYSFLIQLACTALFIVTFFGWWLFNRGLRFPQKLAGLALMVGTLFVVKRLMHPSVNAFMLFRLGLPLAATVAALWLATSKKLNLSWAVATLAVWSGFLLIRGDGMNSRLDSALSWRWTPSAEERYLAEAQNRKPIAPTASSKAETFKLEPTAFEWAEYRGLNRDGVLHGTTVATNWEATPPKLLWKHSVGPSWSSMIVVGQRLFTQEQRGQNEAVVCYDAKTGSELWAHLDETRFDETLSGIGPRATPTLDHGRIYTLGGAGALNCLEAETGKVVWKRDIAADADAPLMQWGFSSSPLVLDGKVYVYAGGGKDKGMLAYRAESGDLAWAGPAGDTSYSSAQAMTIEGVKQIVMLHDAGLSGFDPATGKKFWEAGQVFKGSPRCCQPRLVSTNDIIAGPLIGLGTSSLKVSRQGEQWNVATNWVTKDLKPEFPDFVISGSHAFGFDVSMFTCIDLADGRRVWKEGRYGRGQVVLLADQKLLLVASETGDLVLLAADATAHRELGRIKALEGKTWNGPVVQGDLIFHRNAQEMACYSAGPALASAR